MTNSSEHNDINDPIVQDVLNEFRDEILISKNNKEMNVNLQPPIIHEMPSIGIPNSPNNPSYSNQSNQSNQSHQSHQSHQSNQSHQQTYNQSPNQYYPSQSQSSYPPNPSQNPYSQHFNQHNKNDYMLYIDVELIKKNLIIVIIVFLIYFSGIINNIYDKIPEYLQENILPLDIYIKTLSLYMILYIISYIGYI
jgi:DNA mismatch repair ATPase MutL